MKANEIILVVEGYAENVVQIGRELRAAGIGNRCHFCGSGGEALAYLKGEGEYADRGTFPLPRLMVLGLKLPGGDGLGVLGWVRGKEEFEYMQVIVTAVSAGPRTLDRVYALGANSIVMRSLEATNATGLISLIAEHLGCQVESVEERMGDVEITRADLLEAGIRTGTAALLRSKATERAPEAGFGMHWLS